MLGQECADPVAERLGLWRVVDIHRRSPPRQGRYLVAGRISGASAPVLESVLDRSVAQRAAGDLCPVGMVELVDREACVQRGGEAHGVDGLVHRLLDQQRGERRQLGDPAGEFDGAV